jgi:RNA polymerase sigma-70 factor (ECF subfamily)
LENRDDALDLTAQTFEKVFSKFKTYDSAKAKISTWVFTVARNTLIDFYRKNGRVDVTSLTDVEDIIVDDRNKSMEDSVYIDVQKEKLVLLIQKLSVSDQEIIHLRYTEEMSYAEIAERLGITVNAVGIQLHRAVQKLKYLSKK